MFTELVAPEEKKFSCLALKEGGNQMRFAPLLAALGLIVYIGEQFNERANTGGESAA